MGQQCICLFKSQIGDAINRLKSASKGGLSFSEGSDGLVVEASNNTKVAIAEKLDSLRGEMVDEFDTLFEGLKLTAERDSTLRIAMQNIVEETIEKTMKAEKEARKELIRSRIRTIVGIEGEIYYGELVEFIDKTYGWPRIEIINQIRELVDEGALLSNDDKNLWAKSLLKLAYRQAVQHEVPKVDK